MQFQVKGNDYFLRFDRANGCWFVFEPTARGLRRTPVVNDDAEFGAFRYVVAPDEEHEEIIN
jgi:hypothetical protein